MSHRINVCLAAFVFSVIPHIVSAQWSDNQDAEFVIGQPDFMTLDAGLTSTTLDVPHGVAVDVANGKLYIVEQDNNRVMRYDYPVTGDQPAADLVFGQPNFISNTANNGGIGPDTLNFPVSASVDGTGRLWVVDTANYRVLWYNAAHLIGVNQPDADGVLGQPDFISNQDNRGGTTTADSLSVPIGLEADPVTGTLWVADRSNNRVLRYDNPSLKSNGDPADGVLGQTGFLSNGDGLTSTTFNFPYAMTVEGSTLWVCDWLNYRVLRFDNAASKPDGAPADGVLGQPSFISNAPGTTDSTNQLPHDVAVDQGGRLYLSDFSNHRVLIYENAASKNDGDPADYVLGQPTFLSLADDLNQKGFDFPGCVDIDRLNGKLIVSELANNRVLIFDASGQLPVQTTSFTAE